ncbi:hypothetical protein [Allonocardiopsis opalescens]|uniref:Uncharacterized protein n=1 Tax=Allonocardiopsis opalescens TaxID=1144618 RepID=A0A2T0PXV9_9ACTN|nr:hypothetical protein [Allonocardiopsis opalescens]PRX96380.1 hypothetical protein CLV72_108389 [Allonocardiopsis opalescens]
MDVHHRSIDRNGGHRQSPGLYERLHLSRWLLAVVILSVAVALLLKYSVGLLYGEAADLAAAVAIPGFLAALWPARRYLRFGIAYAGRLRNGRLVLIGDATALDRLRARIRDPAAAARRDLRAGAVLCLLVVAMGVLAVLEYFVVTDYHLAEGPVMVGIFFGVIAAIVLSAGWSHFSALVWQLRTGGTVLRRGRLSLLLAAYSLLYGREAVAEGVPERELCAAVERHPELMDNVRMAGH